MAAPLIAVVAFAVPSASARDAMPPCNRAQARAALDAGGLLAPGNGVRQVVCLDFNRDGQMDMAATVSVNGSAGVVGWAAFVSRASNWKVEQRRPNDYRPSLVRLGSDLLEYEPVYRQDDPNCCPSGGSLDRLYRWRAGRLVLAYSWRQG